MATTLLPVIVDSIVTTDVRILRHKSRGSVGVACLLKAQYRWLIGIISPDIRAENGIIRVVSLLSTYCDAAGVD